MPDITMCLNEECPRKTECYRYMAEPNGWQSYAAFDDGKKCKDFIKYRGTRKKRVELIGDELGRERKAEKWLKKNPLRK